MVTTRRSVFLQVLASIGAISHVSDSCLGRPASINQLHSSTDHTRPGSPVGPSGPGKSTASSSSHAGDRLDILYLLVR